MIPLEREEKAMGRKKAGLVVGVWMAFILLVAVFGVVLNVPVVGESGTIHIRADGSIDPPTAPIQRDGDGYTFTGNIYDSIVVERSNIIVDGDGYTLEGPRTGIGFRLDGNAVTIKNTIIKEFDVPGAGFAAAIYSFDTSNNIITGNTIIDNKWGINLEWVDGYLIDGNTLANHNQAAIYMTDSENNVISNNLIEKNARAITLGGSSNKIYHNDFIDNTNPGFILGENNNVWDDGYPSGSLLSCPWQLAGPPCESPCRRRSGRGCRRSPA